MAHQSPLISIPRKTTTDADWAGPIRSTIAHSFGESPDSYAEEISTLQRCRQDAVRGAGSDTTARDLLYKYFGQLELLELRFAEVKVSFAWHDAFTNKLTTQTSLAFEKASIIHLLASVLSSLAASQSRAGPEGLKRAYFNCRATAGMLTYINENFLHAPSTDLSRDVVHLLINLSLAQATEVFMEKLVDEKKAAGLIARTANQLATMYNGLSDEIKEFMGKGVFDRSWMRLIEAKAKLFSSIAQYQKAKADSASGKYGAALVRYKKADEDAKEALRVAQGFSYQLVSGSDPTLPHDAGTSIVEIAKAHAAVVDEAKKQAIKDNDLIYHDVLPAEASLPAIDKLPPSTPVFIQEVYQSPDVSKLIGPDIFARLIPLAVHESASVYSEEKAKLARGEVERVELSEVEVRAALEHLGLPAAVNAWRRMADGDDADADVEVSSEVVRIASDLQHSGSTDTRVRNVEGERQRVERELQEFVAQLDNESRECERARAKYAPNFTQSPSGPQTASFRQTITANLSALSNAATSDAQLAKLWAEIQPDMAVLQAGPDALRAQARDVALGKTQVIQPAPGESLLDFADEEQVRPQLDGAEADALRVAAKEAGDKLDRLSKIRTERDEVLKDLKAKIQTDDVSNLLLLNRRSSNVEPQLFAAELEKFRPYQSRLASALSVSKSLTDDLEAIVQRVERGRGVRERNRSAKEKAARVKSWERRLQRAGATHTEVADGLARAEGFYASIEEVLVDLRREIRSYVSARDTERNKMVSDIEMRNRIGGSVRSSASPAASPPPPPPPAPGLPSQFGALSLGGTSSYPSPPKAPSPPANPYDFSSLSSLPGAFSTAPVPPAPPKPYSPATASAPSPAAKPSYSSFTNVPSASPYPAPPPPQPQRTYSSAPYLLPGQYQPPTQAPPYPPPPSSGPAYPPPPSASAPYPPPPSGSAPPPPPSRPSYPPPGGYSSPPPARPAAPQYGYSGYTPPAQAQPAAGYPAAAVGQTAYAPYPPPGQQPQQQYGQQYPQPPHHYGQQPPQQPGQQYGQQQGQYGGYRY
ncbi:hypothetical protein CspeluHIS016_0801060 [Cutaneotrichosporon spelunceum]|uniref:BRO domain-containing protein 1 n=1 Tax=Cutaneotrichosporon spelunceum TaxID=1672016 RepID=A0AAD3TZS7_9TREE|nr:hypothetical protein CspeluHIS016_0801060 [Cutaneotrichosporon spelunceum]